MRALLGDSVRWGAGIALSSAREARPVRRALPSGGGVIAGLPSEEGRVFNG